MPSDASNSAQQSVGDYDLIEKVAEGGMGTVYKARHRQTGQTVAIKIVAQHTAGNQVLLKRFEQEYNAARQLDHPNIVKALQFGTTGSTPYLVMEFVDGESLGQRLERDGPMAEKDAIRLIAQVAQGLHRAHKEKLIHRDVKPDNILLTRDGQAKLADLGLVKEVEADLNLTRTGRGLGTPHFMAPEQFKNAKNVDLRGDIYSLGATLYMMVTGHLPFRSSGPLDAYMKKIENKITPPRDLVPTLSERTDWAIRRAMSADPEQRPATCREFIEDLTGRSTRKVPLPDGTAGRQDFWYLIYQDDAGAGHTTKGTTAGIRRLLKQGLLGDVGNVRASRAKDGAFELLRSYPEFRDLALPLGPAGSREAAAAPSRSRPARLSPTIAQLTLPAPPVATAAPRAPHIDLSSEDRNRGWPLWLQAGLLLLIVAASAVAGLFLFR